MCGPVLLSIPMTTMITIITVNTTIITIIIITITITIIIILPVEQVVKMTSECDLDSFRCK